MDGGNDALRGLRLRRLPFSQLQYHFLQYDHGENWTGCSGGHALARKNGRVQAHLARNDDDAVKEGYSTRHLDTCRGSAPSQQAVQERCTEGRGLANRALPARVT